MFKNLIAHLVSAVSARPSALSIVAILARENGELHAKNGEMQLKNKFLENRIKELEAEILYVVETFKDPQKAANKPSKDAEEIRKGLENYFDKQEHVKPFKVCKAEPVDPAHRLFDEKEAQITPPDQESYKAAWDRSGFLIPNK